MASPAQALHPLTLEEFLRLPEETPSLEYLDGRVLRKVSPQAQHSLLTLRILQRINQHAEPLGLGLALPELRCTFDGRSIVPDVAFLNRSHLVPDARGRLRNEVDHPPDLQVAIVSPGQSPRGCREKLAHSTRVGCSLGWLIDPERDVVEVYRPGQSPEVLAREGILVGEPVLPGFRLPLGELFDWLELPNFPGQSGPA